MSKQYIISIGREYGSGGHEIGELLAKRFGIDFYDESLLRRITEEHEISLEDAEKLDEKPKSVVFSRTVRGYTSSSEDNFAYLEFATMKKIADEGKSFVIIGRCGEDVLKDYEGLISMFIVGDTESRVERIMERRDVERREAEMLVKETDRRRKVYHNYHCQSKWGDTRTYDLTINSTRLGIEGTVNILEDYIKTRIENN